MPCLFTYRSQQVVWFSATFLILYCFFIPYCSHYAFYAFNLLKSFWSYICITPRSQNLRSRNLSILFYYQAKILHTSTSAVLSLCSVLPLL